MNLERFKELAAGFAVGALEGAEAAEFRTLLHAASAEDRREAAQIIDAAGLIALSLPRENPSPSLKGKIMARIKPPQATPELFEFVRGGEDSGWHALKVPGAFVKVLSIQKERGYAVLLGKLDPGTSYPAHHHLGAEQLFILEGDLNIGGVTLQAGDFHNAKAGSNHGVNSSAQGCKIMAIVSIDDLQGLMTQ